MMAIKFIQIETNSKNNNYVCLRNHFYSTKRRKKEEEVINKIQIKKQINITSFLYLSMFKYHLFVNK